MLGMQSGTPRDTRIFGKMDIINKITNTYSCSIKAVDTRSTLLGSTARDSNIVIRGFLVCVVA